TGKDTHAALELLRNGVVQLVTEGADERAEPTHGDAEIVQGFGVAAIVEPGARRAGFIEAREGDPGDSGRRGLAEETRHAISHRRWRDAAGAWAPRANRASPRSGPLAPGGRADRPRPSGARETDCRCRIPGRRSCKRDRARAPRRRWFLA